MKIVNGHVIESSRNHLGYWVVRTLAGPFHPLQAWNKRKHVGVHCLKQTTRRMFQLYPHEEGLCTNL